MTQQPCYPIGTPGKKWDNQQLQQWQKTRVKSRSYQSQVVSKVNQLSDSFRVLQYGALSKDTDRYPLFSLTTHNWDQTKPVIVITGGVHGYETSGVHGALQFLESKASNYLPYFNIVVLPCISPWGYEHIERWNPQAIDPNRSFVKNSISEEASSAMQFIAELNGEVLLHIDLHETTDTDESEFRPALSARNGEAYIAGTIPDGFYLVGDSLNKQQSFQSSIINAVQQVTHIAPADENGEIIGSKAEAQGVIYYAVKELGLCAGMTNAKYNTTTEVYPDSEKVTEQDCNNAQVTAIQAALDYIIKHESLNK